MNNIPVEKYSLSGKEVTEGISLITAVKNREETLRQALPTWLAIPEIDEVIIVDWSSDNSLKAMLNEFKDERIILAEVKDQPKWILSYAFNLSARLASRNQLLKMDADVKILPDFFLQQALQPGIFFTGNWRIARNENETHLNGIAFFYRADFIHVNGYSEFITTYGWDDTDLFDRLMEAGLSRSDINPDTLFHIPHEDRVTHQTGTHFLKNIEDKERSTINILMNRYITANFRKWDKDCAMSEFTLKKTNNNLFIIHQTGTSEIRVPVDLLEKSEIVAIRERMEQMNIFIHQDWFNQLNKNDLIALYRFFLLSITDAKLQPDALKLLRKLMAVKPLQEGAIDPEKIQLQEQLSNLGNTLKIKEESHAALGKKYKETQGKLERILNSKTYRYGSVLAGIISSGLSFFSSKKQVNKKSDLQA